MRRNRGIFVLTALCAALVVQGAPTEPPIDGVRKKCISFGWEYGYLTPAQLLANAEKFKDTAIDGVGIYLMATNRAGQQIGTRNFTSGPEWDFEAFADQIPTLKKIAQTDHLRESFLKCFDAPRKRLAWTDDAAWARVGRNMGIVGRISRETGLKGINSDPEDYHGQNQYKPVPGEPPYDELVKIVRRRGREVFGPLFREQPEARVLFYWFLTFEKSYFAVPNPRALAREKQDLWPAFADGIMDVLPPTARIIDGDEHAYRSDYATRGFHVSVCNQRQFAPKLLSPENRVKHALQVQVSFGLYLDMYVNSGPAWYMGPVAGSRVEHFRRNYADAFKLADEYVWLWGERLLTVHWENATINPSVKEKRTWAEALPGLYQPMMALHDADYGFRRRKAELAAKGALKELNINPECRPDAASAKGKLPRPYMIYTGKGKPVFKLMEGQGDGDRYCLSVSGSKTGAILLEFTNVVAGASYAVSCRMKGGDPKAYVGWRSSENKWLWGLGTVRPTFSAPDASGWRTGEAFVEVPIGAAGFAFVFDPKMADGETVLIDNVHVWELSPTTTINHETRATVRRESFIHQGYGNALPRNSMEALMRAWEQGGIPETDARYTKDGVIISFHDGSWKGRRIADCTWAELRDEPVAASRGAQFANIRIPTLDAIFAAMKGHPERRVFLDDKDVGPKALAALARKHGVGAQVIFHTNKSTIAREWKSHCPEGKSNIVIGGDVPARIAALEAEDFAGVDRILIIVNTDFGKQDPFVKPTSDELKKAISIAHRHGVMVNVFFFGDAGLNQDAYVRAIALGADSIGTERPDAFFAHFPSAR